MLKSRTNAAAVAPAVDRVDYAYERIRALIVHGILAPGTRIGEAQLARKLGVSSTPVRGAVNRLRQEGYILASRDHARSRLTVAPVTQDDGRQLYYIVGELEGLAARSAAEADAKIRRRLVQELRRLNDALREVAKMEKPDPQRLFDLDTRFHRAYVQVGAGSRLLAIHQSVRPQWERYERVYFSGLAGDVGRSVEEHERIVRAIQDGDPDVAERAVTANYRRAASRLARVIESLGEQGHW